MKVLVIHHWPSVCSYPEKWEMYSAKVLAQTDDYYLVKRRFHHAKWLPIKGMFTSIHRISIHKMS